MDAPVVKVHGRVVGLVLALPMHKWPLRPRVVRAGVLLAPQQPLHLPATAPLPQTWNKRGFPSYKVHPLSAMDVQLEIAEISDMLP